VVRASTRSASNVAEATDQTFDALVLKSPVPVVVDFYAECVSCSLFAKPPKHSHSQILVCLIVGAHPAVYWRLSLPKS
jgi:thiol:disulfide interchange protein